MDAKFMGQLWDTTSHIFNQILGHTSLKFMLSRISGNWVYTKLTTNGAPIYKLIHVKGEG